MNSCTKLMNFTFENVKSYQYKFTCTVHVYVVRL